MARARTAPTFDQRIAEHDRLQEELAYSAARSDIEVFGISVKLGKRGGSHWFATRIASTGNGADQAWIDRAVRYLDLAGLLVRDPNDTSIVRVLDREPRG